MRLQVRQVLKDDHASYSIFMGMMKEVRETKVRCVSVCPLRASVCHCVCVPGCLCCAFVSVIVLCVCIHCVSVCVHLYVH